MEGGSVSISSFGGGGGGGRGGFSDDGTFPGETLGERERERRANGSCADVKEGGKERGKEDGKRRRGRRERCVM